MIDKKEIDETKNAYIQYFKSKDIFEKISEPTKEEEIGKSSRPRMKSSGVVDDIDKLGEILRKLLNAAWGSSWGIIFPEMSGGENFEEIITPQINYSINLREVSSGTSPKPTLIDTISEEVEGHKTGDSFKVYRQSFDCIIEFNFLCNTSKDCRKLMNDFEELMIIHSGYLKDQGVGEIFFLKEVPPKYSLSYNTNIPMKCCYYFIRIEKNRSVRVSQIKETELILVSKS